MKKKCSCRKDLVNFNPEKHFYPSVSSDSANNEVTKEQQLNAIFNFFAENWERLGLTPIIVLRLLERGWDASELREALTAIIGADFTEIKITVWVERLEAQGFVFPEEDPSFVDIMDRLVFTYIQNNFLKGEN